VKAPAGRVKVKDVSLSEAKTKQKSKDKWKFKRFFLFAKWRQIFEKIFQKGNF
jgi:hypothetical protein